MNRITVQNLKPGMVVARAIFSSDGRILLHSGIILSNRYIKRLTEFEINSVYIRDEIFGEVECCDVVADKTRINAIKMVRENFNQLEKNHSLNTRAVKGMVENIVDELLENRNILFSLSDIRAFDDYTYAHCVNVCILSIMTGITMGYNNSQLNELGIGALLHDIGKIRINLEILNKPGELTRDEFREIKKHPEFGFRILRDYQDLSLLSTHIAYQHHERWDGHGYPRNLAGENILEYARIAAVADVYDALLADRPYRPPYSINQGLNILKRMSGIYLDPTCVTALIANIAVYPIGTVVELNTGDTGIVVDANRDFPTRPVVKIVFNCRRQRYTREHEIDLSKLETIMIVKSLSEEEIDSFKE
ncbi:MAG: HD-GYP domain-containing protein [Syntrophomonadaceae bacterium]|nr:HD-GYP domain-containing protein [Syntrophomonadaceae bacterium]MDD3270546.1 HD-GYP domain-containing protein [Syntrophomonadaceae bacterium]MDD4563104.1 HD-GYP domain-containing protein [Syntrophomonadaceae bacterium]